ncbi:hypothetical protein CYMTET_16175 [Cymbomonas tetramitiformis]|uniref:Uncharacterized protein n=1 Tax=Cymbomonas tetramitiformis TaxID=36881 RepID=A0AAE0GCJ3_9CHLO|nr:hypothetical protein CYMTET_16175 [Cymbomonas tetramitiformis]
MLSPDADPMPSFELQPRRVPSWENTACADNWSDERHTSLPRTRGDCGALAGLPQVLDTCTAGIELASLTADQACQSDDRPAAFESIECTAATSPSAHSSFRGQVYSAFRTKPSEDDSYSSHWDPFDTRPCSSRSRPRAQSTPAKNDIEMMGSNKRVPDAALSMEMAWFGEHWERSRKYDAKRTKRAESTPTGRQGIELSALFPARRERHASQIPETAGILTGAPSGSAGIDIQLTTYVDRRPTLPQIGTAIGWATDADPRALGTPEGAAGSACATHTNPVRLRLRRRPTVRDIGTQTDSSCEDAEEGGSSREQSKAKYCPASREHSGPHSRFRAPGPASHNPLFRRLWAEVCALLALIIVAKGLIGMRLRRSSAPHLVVLFLVSACFAAGLHWYGQEPSRDAFDVGMFGAKVRTLRLGHLWTVDEHSWREDFQGQERCDMHSTSPEA